MRGAIPQEENTLIGIAKGSPDGAEIIRTPQGRGRLNLRLRIHGRMGAQKSRERG